MNKKIIGSGYLFVAAAFVFWISWYLMPDPGTTDPAHILSIVKSSRSHVWYSVLLQVVSSIMYVAALFLLTAATFSHKKIVITGLVFFGIGTLGLCSDAFFHLLVYYMTNICVQLQKNVISVMKFMQTDALLFLVPLLLSFFLGSLLLTVGLSKDRIVSSTPLTIHIIAIVFGITVALIRSFFSVKNPVLTISVLALFAAGQACLGMELVGFQKRTSIYKRVIIHEETEPLHVFEKN